MTRDKERLAGGHREPEREDDDRARGRGKLSRPAPGKVTLIDLGSGSVAAAPGKVTLTGLRVPPRSPASVGKVTHTMFISVASKVEYALRSIDDMFDRRAEGSAPVGEYTSMGASGDGTATEAVVAAMGHSRASDAGQPLPADLAAILSARLRADLSGVRLHRDEAADRAARAVGADAFTTGDDIYFADGKGGLDTDASLHLLACEVARGVDQRPGRTGSFATMMSAHQDLAEFATIVVDELRQKGSRGAALQPAGTDGDRDTAEEMDRARTKDARTPVPHRQEIEKELSIDLGHVTAFTGPAAEAALDGMDAEAAAIDEVVLFRESNPSRELVRHELTHVAQAGPRRAPDRFPRGSLALSSPDSPAEHAAMAGVADIAAPVNVVHRAPRGQTAAEDRSARSTVDNLNDHGDFEQEPALESAAQRVKSRAETAGGDPVLPVSSPHEEHDRDGDSARPNAGGGEARARASRDRDVRAQSSEPERPAGQTFGAHAREPGSGAAGPVAAFSMKAATGDLLASLRDAPPSRAHGALAQTHNLSPGMLSKQRDAAERALPQIETPTGLLPRDTSRPAAKQPADVSGEATAPREGRPARPKESLAFRTQKEIAREAPPAPAPPSTRLAGDVSCEEGQSDPAVARSAQQALASVDAPLLQHVSTRAESVPRVELSSEADPIQLQNSTVDALQETEEARSRATVETQRDFGERNIGPEPDHRILAAQARISEPKAAVSRMPSARVALPAEVMVSIDAEASPILKERIGTEHIRYAEAEQKHDSDSKAAHENARIDIHRLEAETRTQQEQARTGAHTEVTVARQHWQAEIDDIQADFQSKAGDARRDHQRQIETAEQLGNRDASRHIAEAEQKAEIAKRDASDEVAREKKSAAKESKGFFGWFKSKAKALVDGLKKAVNFIYDKLREAVKEIFETAKRLALAAIDLARKAIVGLIKACGQLLKGLVRIALAAFPAIRDRILNRIEAAVEGATQLVNRLAEGLKRAVAAVLDFLASTIDSLLKLVQSAYSAAFTIIGMIVSGELADIMRRLGDLVAAAQTAPGQFETAAYEELLGGNLDEPLSSAELIAAGRTLPPNLVAGPEPAGSEYVPGGEQAATDQNEPAARDQAEAPQPPWTEENVGVDDVASGIELSPELSAALISRAGSGGEIVFGESDDADRSLESILGIQPGSAQGRTSGQETQQPGQQLQQVPVAADGLTPRERAEVKWTLMKQGLTKWWSDNWPYVVGGSVFAVTGFIVATILTGGAILAALPPLMTAIGYLFTGLLVVQLAGHLSDYLQKSWNGDILGGGKSLAKGLAAGAVELLSWLTFKIGSAALKGAKAAAGGMVRGARAAARGTVTVARGALRIAGRGAHYVFKRGKVLLRGVGDAIGRGVKSVRELGERLLSRTRFKGFRIRTTRRQWRLEGRINPWILLASGQIVEVEELPPGAKVGDPVEGVVDGRPGRVVAVGADELPEAAAVARVQAKSVDEMAAKYSAILGDNPSMRSWLARLRSKPLSPEHAQEFAALERRLENAARLRRGEYPRDVTFGVNTFEKLKAHQRILRQAGDELGVVVDKGKLTQQVQDQMKAVIDHVVKNGELRVGRYKHYEDALWSRVNDNIVLRQSDGILITFLKGDSGAAIQFNQALK